MRCGSAARVASSHAETREATVLGVPRVHEVEADGELDRNVDPEREHCPLLQRDEMTSWPAADVESRADRVVERALLGGAGGGEPPVDGKVEGAAVGGAKHHRRGFEVDPGGHAAASD